MSRRPPAHLPLPSAHRPRRSRYMPFIMKAASLALREYPMLNAHVNADCTEITHRAAHNIALAMDTPAGLLVPNVKNVESKSVMEIAAELNRLQELGAAGRLSGEDLKDGTFTLSNIGVVGGTYASPILVVPQVVIGVSSSPTSPRPATRASHASTRPSAHSDVCRASTPTTMWSPPLSWRRAGARTTAWWMG